VKEACKKTEPKEIQKYDIMGNLKSDDAFQKEEAKQKKEEKEANIRCIGAKLE